MHRRCTCDERFRARHNRPRGLRFRPSPRPARSRRSISNKTNDAALPGARVRAQPAARSPPDTQTIRAPTSGSSSHGETARRCRGKHQSLTFPDTHSVSWGTLRGFPGQGVFWRVGKLEGFKADNGPLEIENHAKVAQEVAAEDPVLLKAGRLVNRFQIEHRGTYFLSRVTANGDFGQQGNLYILSDPGRAKHAHSIWLNEGQGLFESGRPFRQHRHGGARVDNEVERFADAFDHHLAA